MSENNYKKGTLSIYGDRVSDYLYELEVKSVEKDNEAGTILIEFNSGEVCVVFEAKDYKINQEEFVINDASRVIWQYFDKRTEKVMKNLIVLDYEKSTDDTIVMRAKLVTKRFHKYDHPAVIIK